MKRDPRRFAPIGLGLAALGLIAVLGVLVIKGFVAAGLYTPRDPQLINTVGLVGTAVVLLGLSLFAILDPERTREILTGRQARHGSNAFLMLLAFTGILIFLNVIVSENPRSWDVTSNKQNSLAPESLKTLAALKEPVTAVAFYTARSSPQAAQTLLEKYKNASNGKFDYSVVDPEADPARAQEAGITEDGTIALYLGQQKELVTVADEQDVTGALVRLMNPQKKAVYFLTGHGERDTQVTGQTAYTTAARALQSKNYTVETLSLIEAAKVPDDAKAVVIAGPQSSLTSEEVSKLKDYLAKGGALVVMEEPVLLTKMGDQPDLLADMLKTDWGITLSTDMVIDPNVNPPLGAVTQPTSSHPITDPIRNTVVLYPTARSLVLAAASSTENLVDLGSTGSSAWGDNNYSSTNQNLSYDSGVDTPGPLQIGAAAEKSDTGARVVVFGDADFADDTNYFNYANSVIFANSIDWAVGQDKLISLTPPSSETRSFQPPGVLAGNGLILLSVCLLPLAVIGGGVWVWVAHRRRG
jgi:ABC-type uncharacterized transport system involved in gliding motility auxiliary subunit